MIHFHYARKATFAGGRAYNFGGDSKSDSSTSTINDTKNYNTVTDRRNVASEQAIALSGDNNVLDRSTSNLTQFFDTSNRSTNFSDTSDRSTTFTDNSNRSTAVDSFNTTTFTDNRVTNTTVTDYGSVNASVGLAGALGTKAFDVAGLGIGGAIDTLKLQSQTGLEATKLAFDLVRSSGANNLASSAAVLNMAQNTIEKSAAAFQEASDGGEKKTIMYAIGAVAVIAVAFAVSR